MKKETNDTIIYTAADIQKYLSGGFTPAEMHAIEKAALDDPFLAEAIEGFDGMKDTGWENHLSSVKQNFGERTEAKVIPLSTKRNDWWKAVAAVIVLGTSSILVYNASKKSAGNEVKTHIAKTETHIDSVKTFAHTTDTGAATSLTSSATINSGTTTATVFTPQTQPVKTIDAQRYTTDQRIVAQLKDTTEGRRADDFVYTPLNNKDVASKKYFSGGEENKEIVQDEKALAAERSKNLYNNIGTTNTNTQNAANSYRFDDKRKAAEVNFSGNISNSQATASAQQVIQYNHPFSAQVLGADNMPLPFANISIKSEGFGTYADVKGNFKLVSTDSLITVQVKSVGYLPRQFVLKSNGQQSKLILSEDQVAIQDVTVIKGKASGKPTRRATLLRDSIVNVEPADGWDNYSAYISNNIDLPNEFSENGRHGEMQISFRVKSDYTITDIKVDNTLCNNCDEEAIKKLIEQGPQWKTKKGKAGKAKIKLQF